MISEQATTESTAGRDGPVVSTELYELFLQHKDRPFFVVRPTGNAGDVLIWLGAEKLMRRAGIRFRAVSVHDLKPEEIPPEHVVYIHGGGVFVPFWSNTPTIAMAEVAKSHPGHLIFGPSSCVDDAEYLQSRLYEPLKSSVCESVTVFARDRTSFAIAERHVPDHVQLTLDHDTALNLTRADLWEGDLAGRYRFFAIRGDAESAGHRVKNPFAFCADPVRESTGFQHWVRLHANATELVTNRLHSSICGSILGIPTTLLPNSYHKNAALWDFSLRDRGVRWSDEVPGRASDPLFALTAPIGPLARRPTARRIIKFLHGATRAQLLRHSGGRPTEIWSD